MILELTEDRSQKSDMKLANLFYINGTTDEPMQFHIIKSGWGNPQMFHVLIEFGDMEQTDYHFMSKEQIKESFDIEFTEIDFVEIVKEFPNDTELGEKIRSIYTIDRK